MQRKSVIWAGVALSVLAGAAPGVASAVGVGTGVSSGRLSINIQSTFSVTRFEESQIVTDRQRDIIVRIPEDYSLECDPIEQCFYEGLLSEGMGGELHHRELLYNPYSEVLPFSFDIVFNIETQWSIALDRYADMHIGFSSDPYITFNYYGYLSDHDEFCEVFPQYCGSDSRISAITVTGNHEDTLIGRQWFDHQQYQRVTGSGYENFQIAMSVSGIIFPHDALHFDILGMENSSYWGFGLREHYLCELTDTCTAIPLDDDGAGIVPVVPTPLPGALGFGLISGFLLAMLKACSGRARRVQPAVA